MDRWEYKQIVKDGACLDLRIKEFDAELKRLGDQGYELAGIQTGRDGSLSLYIFKRKIETDVNSRQPEQQNKTVPRDNFWR